MSHRVLVRVPVNYHHPCPVTALFDEAGVEADYLPGSPPWPVEETRDLLEGQHGILAGGDYCNVEGLAKAGELKVIARSGVGFDRIDVDLCTDRGIVLTTTQGALNDAVADMAMALILAVVRRICQGDRTVKAGQFRITPTEELAVMTLGMVGCGRIGAAVTRRAAAFGMKLLVHDPYLEPGQVEELGAASVELDELLAGSHVVSLHLPMTEESAGIVNADFLGRMRKGSFLINTARGGLVDEEALIAALTEGHLAGAGLDVQATEPPVGRSQELVELENVVAMPHAASNTVTTRARMALWAARSIVEVLQGKRPEHVVNRAVLEKLDLT